MCLKFITLDKKHYLLKKYIKNIQSISYVKKIIKSSNLCYTFKRKKANNVLRRLFKSRFQVVNFSS